MLIELMDLPNPTEPGQTVRCVAIAYMIYDHDAEDAMRRANALFDVPMELMSAHMKRAVDAAWHRVAILRLHEDHK